MSLENRVTKLERQRPDDGQCSCAGPVPIFEHYADDPPLLPPPCPTCGRYAVILIIESQQTRAEGEAQRARWAAEDAARVSHVRQLPGRFSDG